ncbi:uncharacterized protein LOC134224189 isoform X2 [Armigeres subalbatus]|uniref:uncharacterized protein LOC134224189 isoform X2 n=1 Tax=Armigeres subalbatus TaxID=124917 RepID=UPI002ED54028
MPRSLLFPSVKLAFCPVNHTFTLKSQTDTTRPDFVQVNVLVLTNPLDRLLEFYRTVVQKNDESAERLLAVLPRGSLSFERFVGFLLNQTNQAALTEYRELYYPVAKICQPCHTEYQYIVNLDDPNTVSSLYGLLNSRGVSLTDANYIKPRDRKSKIPRKTALRKLSPAIIRQLIEFYEIDRKMLGVGLW